MNPCCVPEIRKEELVAAKATLGAHWCVNQGGGTTCRELSAGPEDVRGEGLTACTAV